jgi:uncharacterized Fe-S cluster protein YjdI
MNKKIVKEYTNGEITVKWQPNECIHATTCFKMLPEVFKPAERPWVKINAASTDKIIETVEACPTAALTWWYNDNKKVTNKTYFKMEDNKIQKQKINLFENGPLHVPAEVDIIDGNGKVLKENEDKYICRCGHSKNKPFCDGSHMTAGFKG